MNAAQKRLLLAAQQQEDGHLDAARAAVVSATQSRVLRDSKAALKAVLSLPASRRAAAIPGVLALIREAAEANKLPPAELLKVMREATRDRVLNTKDLLELTRPGALIRDTRDLEVAAVTKQRQEMNRYWAKESRRFRDDAAKTMRGVIRQGLPYDIAASLLEDRLGVHRGRAVVIAIDQILTAEARAEQSILRAAGLKEFEWKDMDDKKVRPKHQLLDGRVFTWSKAPILPGQEILCRCRAIPPSSREDDDSESEKGVR